MSNTEIDKRIELLLQEFLFHIIGTVGNRKFTPINYEPTLKQFYYWLMENNADTQSNGERERLLKEDRL